MAIVPNGQGRSSKHRRDSHTYYGQGLYWRSEEDFFAWKKEYNEKRSARAREVANGAPKHNTVPKNPRMRGQGASSNKWRPTHPYKRRGRWWRNEEEYRKFADGQALKKRAVRNEVSIDKQVEIELQTEVALKANKKRKESLNKEFMRLKEKHGLRKNAMRVELKNAYARTLDPEIKAFFHLESIAQMKADEKLHAIRDLFLSGARPQEILYRTALMVGVAMKEKQ